MPFRFCLLLLGLLLLSTAGWSQGQPAREKAPGPEERDEVTMRVTLPTAVGVISDYATRLFAKEDSPDRKRAQRRLGTSNPVVTVTIPLPKSWLRRQLTPGDNP